MSNLKKILISAVLAVVLLVGLGSVLSIQHQGVVLGSVAQGNDYQSTTTPTVATAFPAQALLNGSTTGYFAGALANVTITKTDTGSFCLYDATTSDVTKRQASQATSTIILACFPASPTAGTYTFDARYYNGLLITTVSPMASTTITFR